MVSHMADIVRRGIWASLTGGWFYDTTLDLLSNVVHLYIYGSLVVTPFVLYMLFPASEIIWGLYCSLLAVLFFIIKFGNHLLHGFFDTHESEGLKHGQEVSDKDASSRGSLESLSEHLAAFSTDPDGLADWRRLHPRRRPEGRGIRRSSSVNEDIPLRQLDFSLTSAGATESSSRGPLLPQGSASGSASGLSPRSGHFLDWENTAADETVGLMSGVRGLLEERNSNSPTLPSDHPETINFQADVHVLQPILAELRNLRTSTSEEALCLNSLYIDETVLAPEKRPSAPPVLDKVHEISESDAYDKLATDAAQDPSHSSKTARHSSVDNIEERSGRPSGRKRRKARRYRVDPTAENSAASVNQPTSSMETILSTFKPSSRAVVAETSTSESTTQSILPSPVESQAGHSSKGLRRARSEFYAPIGLQAARMTSKSSLEFVQSVSAISPVLVTEQGSKLEPDADVNAKKTLSEPNLENWIIQHSSSTDQPDVVFPTAWPCVTSNELKEPRIYENIPALEAPDPPNRNGWRRSNAVYGRHRFGQLGANTGPGGWRQPPFSLNMMLPADEPVLWPSEGEAGSNRTDLEILQQRASTPGPPLPPRETGEDLSRAERSLRGSVLLRRERENRALMRLDPPDPRARLESLTNSRGLVQTFTSWLTGGQLSPSRPNDDTSEGFLPLHLLDRPSISRTTADDDTGPNRYSPQESTLSVDAGGPAFSSADIADSAFHRQLQPSIRSRFATLTGDSRFPIWQAEDSVHQYPVSAERAFAEAAELDRRRETWQLLPEAPDRPVSIELSNRAALEASLLRASNMADNHSNHSWEYRLGPKSWKELFGDDCLTRQPRVRFHRPFYKLALCLWFKKPREINLHLDRLTLMALFDRTRTVFDCLFAVILAVLVAGMGAVLLSKSYVFDLWAFLLCFVMAGCQYSLLKSVQPDSASPTHGFNRVAVYSRAIYFCAFASLILLMDLLASHDSDPVPLFGFEMFTRSGFIMCRDLLIGCLLCFPVIFAYGLFPQINTFLTYFLEQLDIHIFGGTGTCGLLSASCVLLRNTCIVALLHWICYLPLRRVDASTRTESYSRSGLHIVPDERDRKSVKDFNLVFSLYSSILIAAAYHVSRLSTDAAVLWNVVRRIARKGDCLPWTGDDSQQDHVETDAVQRRIEVTVYNRLRSDIIVCLLFVVGYFGLHATTLFAINTILKDVLVAVAVAAGFILSYVFPRMRAQMPWLCFAKPLVSSYRPNSSYLDSSAPRLTVFEKVYLWLRILERNILFPCILLAMLTNDAAAVANKKQFGPYVASILLTVAGLKFLKLSFRDAENQYLILAFTDLYFRFDAPFRSETFLLNYWLISIFYYKLREWMVKWKFVLTYVAPWQITWGSAFHAFAQPFSIPHSGMLFVQSVFSTLISSPLNPFLGSAIFLSSYPRPIKFWEKNYKTRRLDHSNTRLDAQLDGNSGNDDNNLNSIFYEHLTHSLQKSVCGDIQMGKWGNVMDGDFFILASDYLNCLVHIVEVGNGLVTFQVRGLEFRGTYCQQREVEAITENVDENRGLCCCEPGHLPRMLSLNAAFNQRWLAWQVHAGKYVVQGYSVSDNNASTMFQIYDLRRVLVTFYIKTIIYYLTRHAKLPQWLAYAGKELLTVHQPDYHDLDTLFMPNIDVDFDFRYHGISRHSFYQAMHPWMEHCFAGSNFRETDISESSDFVTLAFAMSVCGRRVLGAAAQLSLHSVDWFLHGLHALFKGDFRINCPRDEWVFVDMELLHKIIAPAIRMALKLHQDHFTAPEEYERADALLDAIIGHETNMVICHEGDPKWRLAVLANTPSLLALRHVVDDNRDEYKVIMLNIRNLDFRLIKVNKECVRGFWAGQLQELIYFRNRNPERGSIQNAKQALRNMINSSCDQPIGYPIYVSPLTTSYADTHENLSKAVGGPLTWETIRQTVHETWEEIRDRCYASCSGSSGEPRVIRPRDDPVVVTYNPHNTRPVEITARHNEL